MLVELCQSLGMKVSTYSRPENYKPHITMGYSEQKPLTIIFQSKIKVQPQEFQLGVGNDIIYRRVWVEESDTPTPLDDEIEPTSAKMFLPDDVFKELKVAARKGGAFVPDKLPAPTIVYIKALKELGYETDVVFEAAKSFTLSVLEAKSVSETQRDFEREFDALIEAARNDEKSRKQVGGKLRYFINQYVDRAFLDGMVDGGLEDAILTPEDRDIATQFKSSASTFVTNFLNQLYKGDGITDDQTVYKATQWWNGTIYPAYVAGLERAAADSMFEWKLGKTEKHCASCRALNGQRHRFSEFKAAGFWRASDKLICGRGKLCDCDLVPSKGRSKGRLDTVPVAARSMNLLDMSDEEIEDLKGELEGEGV